MNIHVADSDEEIAACFPVMCELRVHLTEESFISQICSQELSGYRLAYLMADRQVVSVTSTPAEKFVYTAGGRTNEHPAVAQCQARWGSHHFAQEPL